MRIAMLMKKRIIVLLALMHLVITSLVLLPLTAHAKNDVPPFSGNSTIELNRNVPVFSKDEITIKSFEKYGKLDGLGRCTTAIACIGKDLMPTEERESIGSIMPTGWNQNKYPGIVDSEPPYLYNRCHLIGYQLTGENANERNLITGTRYMNIYGMLPYENMVAEYVVSTGNHVMYRVTPIFEGKNLLCSGVQIEAYSVEDAGKGISFNVFCYNVQPGVNINYFDGSNSEEIIFKLTSDENSYKESSRNSANQEDNTVYLSGNGYVANKNTKKFHYISCDSVANMKEENKLYYEGDRQDLLDMGYIPCKACHP